MSALRVVPIKKRCEKQFFDYLDRDRILHVFTIYDLKHMRDNTEVWIAFDKENTIVGYLLEFKRKVVHIHGESESITELLDRIDIDEPVFIIEPRHLGVVRKFYEPVQPTDSSSKGRITTFLVMKIDAEAFRPSIRHRVKRLGTEDLNDVSKEMGDEYGKVVENAIQRGIAFGAYENGSLASVATVPQIIDGLALIRGIYTVPNLRRTGLATSACSALVEELVSLGRKAMLRAARDNVPARKVYEKIGFKKTGHILLGFKARRL